MGGEIVRAEESVSTSKNRIDAKKAEIAAERHKSEGVIAVFALLAGIAADSVAHGYWRALTEFLGPTTIVVLILGWGVARFMKGMADADQARLDQLAAAAADEGRLAATVSARDAAMDAASRADERYADKIRSEWPLARVADTLRGRCSVTYVPGAVTINYKVGLWCAAPVDVYLTIMGASVHPKFRDRAGGASQRVSTPLGITGMSPRERRVIKIPAFQLEETFDGTANIGAAPQTDEQFGTATMRFDVRVTLEDPRGSLAWTDRQLICETWIDGVKADPSAGAA
jgi:hypothetical protein